MMKKFDIEWQLKRKVTKSKSKEWERIFMFTNISRFKDFCNFLSPFSIRFFFIAISFYFSFIFHYSSLIYEIKRSPFCSFISIYLLLLCKQTKRLCIYNDGILIKNRQKKLLCEREANTKTYVLSWWRWPIIRQTFS